MSFRVRLTREAEADLERSFDFVLERELASARQSGLARDNEELELGVRCMAAGIYDDQLKLVAGLSISAPADRLDEGWLDKLQATAQKISQALGQVPA